MTVVVILPCLCYDIAVEKQLPSAYEARMREMLGEAYADYAAALIEPPLRGLRVNGLRLTPEAFAALSPWHLRPSPTLPEGFILAEAGPARTATIEDASMERATEAGPARTAAVEDASRESATEAGIGAHPYHLAGLFYMQEPSAMAAVAAADARPGMRVLDLCAAPGGKAGAMAARMGGEGLLVANEIVGGRARVLLANLQRLGVCNAVVTNAHPETLCSALPAYFDLVLVDAPCSGEGMFRKDETAVAAWSVAHVQACAERQRAILASAQKAVKGGGALVYSTCTFSREENEDTIGAFLAAYPAFQLQFMRRIYPQEGLGEGHFVARLIKCADERADYPLLTLAPCKEKSFTAFMEENFAERPIGQPVLLQDGRVKILPQALPGPLRGLRMLCAGIAAGECKNGRFTPAHALAMAAEGQWRKVLSLSLEDPRLRQYLHGETISVAPGVRGWQCVCVEGYPLSLGKAVDGILKNHLPKEYRR